MGAIGKRWWRRLLDRLWALVWEPDPVLQGNAPCERCADKPLVVISASVEWNVRQNALEEAAQALAAECAEDAMASLCEGPAIVRALMTAGPELASNPMEHDRVPGYYELATMYRDLWAELNRQRQEAIRLFLERDEARAELKKVRDILHDAEITPASSWAQELAAAKGNAAGLGALLEEAEKRASLAEMRLNVDAARLADEVDVLVQRRIIDSRSPAADALLDFRDRFPRTPRSDRLAKADEEIDRLRRLALESKEWGARLNILLSMLGPRCGETGLFDERAEGALRRILDEREELRRRLAG